MKKLFTWLKKLDNNVLTILLVGFAFFIPLYPKFPFKIIEYTYIAIRLEDFYIVLLTLVFFIQLIRRKVRLQTQLLVPMLIFWVVVFTSFFNAAFFTKTVPVVNVGFLHATRRVEYMIIFFIVTSSIRSLKTFKIVLYSLISSFILVNLYGVGQRFIGFPAVSTMNPEFARGHLLYLTPEARVSSTFGGHYDFAIYLVMFIPLVLGLFFRLKNKIRYVLFFSVLLAIFMLVLTALRIGFATYVVMIISYLIFVKKFKYLFFIIVFTILVTLTNKDLTERFSKTLQIKQILVNEQTGQVFVPQKITSEELPLGSYYIPINKKVIPTPQIKTPITTLYAVQNKKMLFPTETSLSTTTALFKKQVAVEEVTQEAIKNKQILSEAEEKRLIASFSALLKPVSGVVCDISCSTRIQVEWPRAIVAFLKNPLIGSGGSSITEATDNDYLRWLGEFGLFGFLAFLYIIVTALFHIVRNAKNIPNPYRGLTHAFVFSTFGLFIIAVYFDVFEASKIAFIFWFITGLLLYRTPHEREKTQTI